MKKSLFAVLTIVGLMLSCDKDYNTIGSGLVGDGNYDFEMYPVENIKAYSKPTGPVQSNNLPVNALGVYANPSLSYGTSLAHFVTDLQLSLTAPDFGYDITIEPNDSVYIYIPYFYKSNETETDDDGNRTFVLDSVYGDLASSINLKIYQNKYYLRDFDANDPTIAKKYYSDENDDIIEPVLGIQLNNSTNVSENSEFKFSNNEYVFYKSDGNGNYLDENGDITTDTDKRVVKERLEPGLWVNLDKDFFLTEVLNASPSDLLNNNNFKEHLKGLYFQVEQNTDQEGAMAVLDFSKGYINIQYHSKSEDTAESELKKKSFKLNLKGNTVNFFENNTISDGEDRLYLKGGDGSVAFIDLFGNEDVKKINSEGEIVSGSNDVPDELDELRASNLLINDAVLTFTIDQASVEGKEPTRIYVFDATNNIVILDYSLDTTTYTNAKYNKLLFGGFLEVDEDKKGIKYSIRITSHINKIINNDDPEINKNVVLGISLTDNINVSTSVSLKNTITIPVEVPAGTTEAFNSMPQSSVITPLGTVLFGNHPDVAVENRPKLEIYYTKPN